MVLLLGLAFNAMGKNRTITGKVISADRKLPLSAVIVTVDGTQNWAVTDAKGEFTLANVDYGTQTIVYSLIGYVELRHELLVDEKSPSYTVALKEDNLKIDDVVVTAKAKSSEMSSAHIIGGKAIEHLQMNSISDIATLLPGASTINPDLTQNSVISLRDGGMTAGNPSFGTALEVDGVRLSTNASFKAVSGVGARDVATANVDKVEVITGVPSAEYGDIGSGIVKVHTSKGRTPWKITFTTNPRTKVGSIAKGFDLGKGRGAINTSIEYAYATNDLMSPYTSYSRRGITLAYSNTFRKRWKFTAGVTGNLGGMNSENDPDARTGEYERDRDNSIRGNASVEWLLNKKWISNLRLEGAVNYTDNLSKAFQVVNNASQQPAVHSLIEGYYFTDMLPESFSRMQYIDSKELDVNLKLRADWNRKWNNIRSGFKLGVAFQSNGNMGKGEYYNDQMLAPSQYRPRPYTDYPFMHNLAFFAEEKLTIPLGRKDYKLDIMAGVRVEGTFIKGANYDHKTTASPRLNAKLHLGDNVTIRGGWGFAEKLPSFYVLYPHQEYRDFRVFSASYQGNKSVYAYYTQPYKQLPNPSLRWQRNRNAEIGIDLSFGGFDLSLTAFSNKTKLPYRLMTSYSPMSYRVSQLPASYSMPANPQFKIDPVTGIVEIRDYDYPQGGWTMMDTLVENRTFVGNSYQTNGSDVIRRGIEMVMDFPEIRPINTQFRLDAAYTYSKYLNTDFMYYYPSRSSFYDQNMSYEYVGIYANTGSSSSTYNGQKRHVLRANLTAITRIPQIRMVITVRLEASLLQRWQNISEFNGKEYAVNVGDDGKPSGGSIYDGNSYVAMYPLAYMDTSGRVYDVSNLSYDNPRWSSDLQGLVVRSGNSFIYAKHGYNPYFSANISLTKEFGDHVSISMYVNNFTNSRKAVRDIGNGVSTILTPSLYYGLTLRLKF